MEIAGTSAVIILGAAPRFVRSFFHEESQLARRAQVWRFGIFLLLQVAALAIGVDLLRGDAGSAGWLAGVELILLGSAARNSWEMLIEMGESRE